MASLGSLAFLLALLSVPAQPSEFTFRVPADFLKAATDESFFQLTNASHVASPSPLDASARFGESLDAFRHHEQRLLLVGAPQHRNRSGAVFLCPFEAAAGEFRCEQRALPLTRPPKSQPDDARGMLLGAAVAAVTTSAQEGFALYCGHLYRRGAEYKGLCNLLPIGSREKGPVALSPCVAGSCLAGFAARLALSQAGGGDLVLAIGAPDLEPGRGQVLVSRVPLATPRKPDRFHFSHQQDSLRSRAFYRGYAAAFLHEGQEDRIAVTTPSDFRVARLEIFGGLLQGGTYLMQQLKALQAAPGQGFGLALASLHLTGAPKQRQDLLVGEPFFGADVGRAVVFCRRGNHRTLIVGPEPNGRFGAAVAAVPDVNGDGLDELAVGCPYCDEGRGAVFFFLGHPECRFNAPAQVLLARQAGPTLRQFGSALSAGVDFDINGARDLVIGAPGSGRAVLIRGRVVLGVTSSVLGRCIIMTDLGRVRECELTFNFDIRPVAADGKVPELKRVRCQLDLDSLKSSLKRLAYKGSPSPTFNVTLQRRGNGYSAVVRLRRGYIKTNQEALRFDRTTPVNISALVELLPEPAQVRNQPLARLQPLPGAWSKTVTLGNAACGMRPCQADFEVEISTDRYPDRTIAFGQPNVTLIVHVRNKGPELDDIDSALHLGFDNGLQPLGVRAGPLRTPPECASAGESEMVCQLGASFASQEQLSLQVDMDALAITNRANWDAKSASELPHLSAKVVPASMDLNFTNNADSMKLKVRFEPKLRLSPGAASRQTVVDNRNASSAVRERQRVHWERLGPQLRQVYHLVNPGSVTLHGLELNLSLPVASELGERLLYLAPDVRVGGSLQPAGPRVESESGRSRVTCDFPPGLLNPLNLVVIGGAERLRRVRRSPEPEELPEELPAELAPGQDRVECGAESRHFGRPACANIRCRVDQLLRKDSLRVVLEAWIWSDTLLRRRVTDLEVVTAVEGLVTVVPPMAFAPPGSLLVPKTNQSTHVVFPHVRGPVKGQLPIWIIVLAVVAGVILLGLIVLCLRQLGFFKRRRRQPYAEHVHRFQKYGGSSDLDLEDDDEEEAGARALLPGPGSKAREARRGQEDVATSDTGTSAASSPAQALQTRADSSGKLSQGSL